MSVVSLAFKNNAVRERSINMCQMHAFFSMVFLVLLRSTRPAHDTPF